MNNQSQDTPSSNDLPALRSDEEMLQFAFMLSGLCSHCAIKANLALLSAKMYCATTFHESKDERYADPRYILSYAINFMVDAEDDEDNGHQPFQTDENGTIERSLH